LLLICAVLLDVICVWYHNLGFWTIAILFFFFLNL